MTSVEACIKTRYIKIAVLMKEIRSKSSPLRKSLKMLNVSLPQPPIQGAALKLAENYLERFAQFLRNYLTSIPTVKSICEARWNLISYLPKFYIPRYHEKSCNALPHGPIYVSSSDGRIVKRARVSLLVVVSRLLTDMSLQIAGRFHLTFRLSRKPLERVQLFCSFLWMLDVAP